MEHWECRECGHANTFQYGIWNCAECDLYHASVVECPGYKQLKKPHYEHKNPDEPVEILGLVGLKRLYLQLLQENVDNHIPDDLFRVIISYLIGDIGIASIVDACDKVNQWYPAVIVDETETSYLMHYFGWARKWDEWIDKDSAKLMPWKEASTDYGRLPRQTKRFVSSSRYISMGFDKKKIDNCLYATMYRRYATKRYVNIYGVPDAYIPLNVPEIADIWNEKKTKEFLDADN